MGDDRLYKISDIVHSIIFIILVAVKCLIGMIDMQLFTTNTELYLVRIVLALTTQNPVYIGGYFRTFISIIKRISYC